MNFNFSNLLKKGGNNATMNGGLFSGMQTPAKFDLAGGYNTGVLNTGNYNLPTQTSGATSTGKPLGDYSFTKDVKDYVPDTDFAQNIVNKEVNPWKSALSNGLQAFSESNGQSTYNVPKISVSGFNFQNGQINPAQQVKSNLYNFLVR